MSKPIDLAELGVQVPPPSKRPVPTKRVYAAPLDDAMLARIKARVERERKERLR